MHAWPPQSRAKLYYGNLLNFASNLAGLAVLLLHGKVIWMIGLSITAASMAGGQVGAHLAIRLGARMVRPLLIVMCIALTAKLLSDRENPLATIIWSTFA